MLDTTMYANWQDALAILPHHMRDGMERYIRYGVEGGGFMMAVLENDFIGAYRRADFINARSLHTYADFLSNHVPEDCWGSRMRVQKWLAIGGLDGQAQTQQHNEDEEC